MSNNTNNSTDIKHKTLFFFMPDSVVFVKNEKNDVEEVIKLKQITPHFYWCSAHEFFEENMQQKYLIQNQIFSIENNNIQPGELTQIWASSKSDVRAGLINFLDKWNDHKRILFNSESPKLINSDSQNSDNHNSEHIFSINNLSKQNFSDFAEFVGKSIFNLKFIYLEQVKNGNFDSLQKDFWKNMAIFYMGALQNINNSINEKSVAEKTKRTRKKSKKTIKEK